ncbi:MAG: glucoamylase family protein, partial [Rhodanobacter sp.]
MIEASRMKPQSIKVARQGKTGTIEIKVQPQSVTAIELRFAPAATPAGKESHKVMPAPHVFTAAQGKLLEKLQSDAFRYFTEYANPDNGLVADSTKAGSAASISATGFALSCYPIAAERGWLSRKQAMAITLKTLRFFHGSRQGKDAKATGYKGFYYHFLDMHSGKRAEHCELSTIDTAMLLSGMLVASEYFDRKSTGEKEIRSLSKALMERVDWNWTLDGKEVNHSWTPTGGFKKADWEGYTEALMMYVFGAASVSHPIPREVYELDAQGYEWHHNAGLEWIHATPLFIHLFPQAWLDLRGLQDGFVSKHADIDYAENTRRAIQVQRDYANLNPQNFAGYGGDIWGLSACMGPEGKLKMRNGKSRKFLGYAARGVTHGPDDGTLVPWGAATCMAHAPEAALAGMQAMLKNYPRALSDGQFIGGINPSLPGDGPEGWLAPSRFGLDQGLVIMMIENARSGLIWELTRNSSLVKRGLTKLGFGGGWLR